jgi:ABC-type transporter Mla subunit MlaD
MADKMNKTSVFTESEVNNVDYMGQSMDETRKNNDFLSEASKGINQTMENVGETVKTIKETVKSASETFKAAGDVIQVVKNPENGVTNLVDDASKGINLTLESASETVKAVSEAVRAVDETVKIAGETLGTIYSAVEEPIEKAIDKIADVLIPEKGMGSPVVRGLIVSVSLSLLLFGLYSFFRPKQAV